MMTTLIGSGPQIFHNSRQMPPAKFLETTIA